MNDELPAPPVPDCVDLRDFGFMPLDVMRLRDSEMAVEASGDEFKAAVLLWCAAWHQIPAGSLPSKDTLLADYSKAGHKWPKVREQAMRGFIQCSDGRLYHSVIAEKALQAWGEKLAQRARTAAATAARQAKQREQQTQRDDQRDVARNVERHDKRQVHRDDQRDDARNVHQGTGTGTGNKDPHTPAKRGPRVVHHFPPGFEAFWAVYPKKSAKDKASHAFVNARIDEPLLQRILGDVRRRAQSEDWRKERGRYIPAPTTYLNQRRWEDVVEVGETVDAFAGAL